MSSYFWFTASEGWREERRGGERKEEKEEEEAVGREYLSASTITGVESGWFGGYGE